MSVHPSIPPSIHPSIIYVIREENVHNCSIPQFYSGQEDILDIYTLLPIPYSVCPQPGPQSAGVYMVERPKSSLLRIQILSVAVFTFL